MIFRGKSAIASQKFLQPYNNNEKQFSGTQDVLLGIHELRKLSIKLNRKPKMCGKYKNKQLNIKISKCKLKCHYDG
jgi:hypothetical protein